MNLKWISCVATGFLLATVGMAFDSENNATVNVPTLPTAEFKENFVEKTVHIPGFEDQFETDTVSTGDLTTFGRDKFSIHNGIMSVSDGRLAGPGTFWFSNTVIRGIFV
jgi:hypothetical protein